MYNKSHGKENWHCRFQGFLSTAEVHSNKTNNFVMPSEDIRVLFQVPDTNDIKVNNQICIKLTFWSKKYLALCCSCIRLFTIETNNYSKIRAWIVIKFWNYAPVQQSPNRTGPQAAAAAAAVIFKLLTCPPSGLEILK